MRKGLKTLISIGFVGIVCMFFGACSTQPAEKTEGTAQYSLVEEKGNHYIIFDNASSLPEDSSNLAVAPSITFKTVKEFHNSVTKNLLTEEQKKEMTRFKKDEQGRILSCDFDNLYTPTTPDASSSRVIWYGSYYYFTASWEDGRSAKVQNFEQSDFEKKYQEDYVNIYKNPLITVSSTEIIEGNKEVTYYSTNAGEFKDFRYSLSSEGKTIYVHKLYRLKLNHNLATPSDIVPASISLFCTEEDRYYTVKLHGLKEDPTDEWLLQFGLTKYVENDHVEK